MEIINIVGLGIVAVILVGILKTHRPEFATQVSIVLGIVVFFMVAGKLKIVMEVINGFTKRSNIDPIYITTLIKVIGIAYIAEFGAEVCRDAGEGAIASKIELAGKVIIVVFTVPIMASVLDLITRNMP